MHKSDARGLSRCQEALASTGRKDSRTCMRKRASGRPTAAGGSLSSRSSLGACNAAVNLVGAADREPEPKSEWTTCAI